MSKNLVPRAENSAKTVRGNPDKTLPHRWQRGQSGRRQRQIDLERSHHPHTSPPKPRCLGLAIWVGSTLSGNSYSCPEP